ncbi:MAG: hypothetical protein ACQETB_07650 [Halobacteriota archaeon]
MRRQVVIAVVVVGVAFVFVGGPSLFVSPSTSDIAPETDRTPEIVSFEDSDSGFWPYLNARKSFEKQSPINVVVRGDVDEIIRLLSEDGDWEELDEEEPHADSGTYAVAADDHLQATPTEWGETTGATRYAWVDPGPDGDGYWVPETMQVHDGEYYGHRVHVRMYEAPIADDRWVAMQAHSEHFDWFTLRHRVDGVESAQLAIESDLMALSSVDSHHDVRRINLDNSGPSDADGWATVVDLLGFVSLPVLFGLLAGDGIPACVTERVSNQLSDRDRRRIGAVTDRIEPGHLILSATVLTLVLGVRVLGIGIERSIDAFTMHMIAALLYPVLALGLPISTYAIASRLERRIDAAITASMSLSIAFWLDYGALGVDTLPIDVVAQRILVVVTLGMIAAGAAKRSTRDTRWNELLVSGVVLWTVGLSATLFGYL